MPAYRTPRTRLREKALALGLGSLAQAAQAEGLTATWFAVDEAFAYVLEPEPLDPVPEGWEEVLEEEALRLWEGQGG